MRNDSNAEQERLKQLRDRQLATRDPRTEQRRYHQQAAQRGQTAFKMPSFKEAWADIPHVWKNFFYSLITGLLALVVIPVLWPSTYAFLCVGGGTLALLIFGLIVGKAMDSRDEIKNLIK